MPGSNRRPPACKTTPGMATLDHEPRRTPVSMRVCGVLGTQSPHAYVVGFRIVLATSWPRHRGGVAYPVAPHLGTWRSPRSPDRSRRPPPMPCGYHDPRRGADPSTGRFQQLSGKPTNGAAALSRAAPATGRSRPPRRRCPDAARMRGSAGFGFRAFPSSYSPEKLATRAIVAGFELGTLELPRTTSSVMQLDAFGLQNGRFGLLRDARKCSLQSRARTRTVRAQLVSVGVTRSWAKRNSSSLSRPRP